MENGTSFLDEDATFLSQMEKHARENPSKAAFIFVDKDLKQRVLTMQNVWDLTRKCAAVMKRLGLGKGDIVCNTLVNSPERLLTFFGTVAAGATPTQGQLLLADGSDLINNLRKSRATAIIYDPNPHENGAKRILDQIKFKDETTGAIRYKDLPDLKRVIEIDAANVDESERWINVIDKEEDLFVDESITKDDVVMVFLTSGTTGFSKLVPHTHTTVMTSMHNFRGFGGLHRDMVLFNMQSLGWLGGFPAWLVVFGCTRVLIDLTNGHPDNLGPFLVDVFNLTKPTNGFLITRDAQYFLDALNAGSKLDNLLVSIFTGGGPVHNATMEALGRISHKVLIGYGGTEFLLVSCNDVDKKSDFQDMCTGCPIKCQVRIVGEDGNDVATGEQGHILMRSGTIFKGYMNDPEKTAAAFTEDGWYKTGDLGYLNKEGQLFVLCRMADVITKDGFCHYPGWMEQMINKHPAIQQSLVIGIPDPAHHEEICLCYRQEAGTDVTDDSLREYCKKLFLTDENDKITPLPKYYFAFQEFITNSNGKVDRKKMQEEILRRLAN